jgi:hypothetical protein
MVIEEMRHTMFVGDPLSNGDHVLRAATALSDDLSIRPPTDLLEGLPG